MNPWSYTSKHLPNGGNDEVLYEVSYLWGGEHDSPMCDPRLFNYDANLQEFHLADGVSDEQDIYAILENGGLVYAWRIYEDNDPAPWPRGE